MIVSLNVLILTLALPAAAFAATSTDNTGKPSGHDWTIRNNIVRDTTGKGIDCGSETWGPESLIATESEDRRVLIGGHHLVEGNLVTDNAQCGIAAWNADDVHIIGNIVRNNGVVVTNYHVITDSRTNRVYSRVLFRLSNEGAQAAPQVFRLKLLLADVNNDGKSEIIVSVGDGYVYVLGK